MLLPHWQALRAGGREWVRSGRSTCHKANSYWTHSAANRSARRVFTDTRVAALARKLLPMKLLTYLFDQALLLIMTRSTKFKRSLKIWQVAFSVFRTDYIFLFHWLIEYKQPRRLVQHRLWFVCYGCRHKYRPILRWQLLHVRITHYCPKYLERNLAKEKLEGFFLY